MTGRMGIERFDDGGAFVEEFGYCRALRVGDQVFVSGTTARDTDPAGVPASVYEQTKEALGRVVEAVHALAPGAVVVRTRVYLTDGSTWREAGRAHAEVFGDSPPTNTTLEVSALIGPGLKVEVEADAIAGP